MELTPLQQKFVLHWGEMGTRWGINRTVAQVHALLYLSPAPLCADDMVAALGVARSNVSNSLKELQGWGIVHQASVLGERKDYFVTTADVWEMFQTILDERKRREIDPTLALLRECVAEAQSSKAETQHTKDRLRDLLDLLESCSRWYSQVRLLPTGAVVKFVKMGSKVWKVLGLAG